MRPRSAGAFAIAVAVLATACGGDDGPGVEPHFPADYRATYVEVRDCRPSGDHNLNNIRVLVDPAARGPYEGRDAPFPVGAVVLKEEYDFGDPDCSGDIVRWDVIVKLEEGTAPDRIDWDWQAVDVDRTVIEDNAPRCFGCHQDCLMPPEGYGGTCAVP